MLSPTVGDRVSLVKGVIKPGTATMRSELVNIPRFIPADLSKLPDAFDHDDFIFELFLRISGNPT
jgi:hypothetical protein